MINGGYIDCYPQLNGPYDVVFMADPPEGGRIDLPSFEIDTYPYNAAYFGGVPVTFDADENDGFVFSHWSSNGTVFAPDEFAEAITVSFTANDTLTAHFVPDVSHSLTLDVEPDNSGTITIGGTTYSTFPATINLTESVVYSAKAEPISVNGFSDWESGLVLSPNAVVDSVTFSINSNSNLTAQFYEILNDVTIENASKATGQIVFPNPSSGAVTVESTEFQPDPLQVFSVLGILVYQTTLYGNQEAIDLSTLSPGLYLLNFNNRTTKLVIEK